MLKDKLETRDTGQINRTEIIAILFILLGGSYISLGGGGGSIVGIEIFYWLDGSGLELRCG